MGPIEIILIVLVIVLLFGARKLPELGKGAGQSIREFRKGASGERTASDDAKPDDRL